MKRGVALPKRQAGVGLHVEKRLRRISPRLSCTPGFPMIVKSTLSVARRLKTPIDRFNRREAETLEAALNGSIARCEASCCKNWL